LRNRLWFSIFAACLALLALLTVCCGYVSLRGLERQLQTQMTSELLRLGSRIETMEKRKTADLSALSELVNEYQFGKGGFIWIMDDRGQLLAYSQRQRVLNPQVLADDRKESIPFILKNPDRNGSIFSARISGRYVVFSRIRGTNRFVVLTCTRSEIETAADGVFRDMAIAFYILAFAGLFISFLIAEYFGKKVNRYREFLTSLDSGNPEAEPLPCETDGPMKDLYLISQSLGKKLRECEKADLSPLTGLPSNKSLQNVLFGIIDSKKPLALAFVDINNFGSYNRKYGFEKGDSVIRLTAALIANKTGEFGNSDDLTAHLGADHFAFVTTPDKYEKISQEIISSFDEQIRHHYEDEDLKHGYILSKDRKGNIDRFPIMTISIGIATNTARQVIHPLQIIQTTSEIRDYLREKRQSSFLADRRMEDRDVSRNEKPPEKPQESDREESV
jgi:diguanylate cyclase (GGDEF)-like protein